MKRPMPLYGLITAAVIAFVTLSAFAPKVPSYYWDFLEYDFGKIKQNKPVTASFKFKNSGDTPLVISKAKASCGCTVAEYSQTPIAANEEGFVKVTFNASNIGKFHKSVTLTSNVPGEPVLINITGQVIP